MSIPYSAINALRHRFVDLNYTIEGLSDVLGEEAFAALFRREPVPVWRATDPSAVADSTLARLIRFILLGEYYTQTELERLLNLSFDEFTALQQWGFIVNTISDLYQVGMDVRPVDTGFGTRWVFSDLDGALFPVPIKDDHVLGVGEASLSLLRATPLAPVDKLLDLGTGCGIQTLHAKNYATQIIATDISERCCELAEATLLINGQSDGVEFRSGSWFTPVERELFDAIVANPPFVVSAGDITHSYRDSGFVLDGATKLMIERCPQYLSEQGSATILGSWVHKHNEDYRSRLASWVPAHGLDVWIVERDHVDASLYVATWMEDSGRNPADPKWRDYAANWLQYFDDNNVESIGFGIIYLRKTSRPSTLLVEELTDPRGDALAAECAEHWKRWDNLVRWTNEELLQKRFFLAPTALLSTLSVPHTTGQGIYNQTFTISRSDMPSYHHEIDEAVLMILKGLSAEGPSVADVAQLLCKAKNWTWEEMKADLVEIIRDLYLHGLILH